METIVISIATSIIAGLLVAYFLKLRDSQLKRKIEEVASHEKYLEKLSRGNVKLLRSSLFLILSSFCCLFVAMIIFSVIVTVELNPQFKIALVGMTTCMLTIAASTCFFQAKAIIQSADLKKSRKILKAKREKLESKLT